MNRARRPPEDLRGRFFLLILALVTCGQAADGLAQIPTLSEMPWRAAADTSTVSWFELALSRDWHPPTGWKAHRLEMTVVARAGGRASFYVRVEFLSFATAGTPLFQRWPFLQNEETEEGWPHERTITGWGRPELGILFPLHLPILRSTQVGLGLGLPVGQDALYPFSATAMPLRIVARRVWSFSRGLELGIRGGREQTFDTSTDQLAGEAFTSGWRYGAEGAWWLAPRRGFEVRWSRRDLDGRRSERLALDFWIPVSQHGRLGFCVAREVGEQFHRASDWHAAVIWRFTGLNPQADGEAGGAVANDLR